MHDATGCQLFGHNGMVFRSFTFTSVLLQLVQTNILLKMLTPRKACISWMLDWKTSYFQHSILKCHQIFSGNSAFRSNLEAFWMHEFNDKSDTYICNWGELLSTTLTDTVIWAHFFLQQPVLDMSLSMNIWSSVCYKIITLQSVLLIVRYYNGKACTGKQGLPHSSCLVQHCLFVKLALRSFSVLVGFVFQLLTSGSQVWFWHEHVRWIS